ncbi:MAG: NirA family protein [Pseudomonadota bacterium]
MDGSYREKGQRQKGFTPEQVACLVDALGKLELQNLFQAGGGTQAAPAPEAVHGTPLEDLCKEEVAKYKLHPLDLWERLEHWTAKNEIATGLDQFLLRHLGFFNVEPTSPGYMVRLRIPACRLRGDQMLALAAIAETFGGGYAHVTTRGNIQIREIEPKDVLNVIDALNEAGLSCQGSGADSARNMTASPTAGFDRLELIDLSPFTRRLSNLVLNTRELRALPRKFNISFDNGGTISCVADSNDIAFQAVEIGEGAGLEPGIYCRIGLGGISGHRDLTRETGMVCTPEQSVMAGYAMLHVFCEHADRTNRKKARLKYLLDREGVDWFIARTQEKLDALDAGFRLTPLSSEHDRPRPTVDRQAHIGAHPQRQDGLSYVGIALEMGRLSPAQMRVIGRLAMETGDNDLRLTVWQNLLIPHLPAARMAEVETALAEAGLATSATAFAAGAVGCTGKAGCKLALAYTKEDGTALVRHLESRFTLDQPINIHLTGCPNSCAQHYIGDIGLMGATLPDGSEGYYVVLGGGSDGDKGVGRPLCGPIPSTGINAVIEGVIAHYLAEREAGETFLSFVRRTEDAALPALLSPLDLAS